MCATAIFYSASIYVMHLHLIARSHSIATVAFNCKSIKKKMRYGLFYIAASIYAMCISIAGLRRNEKAQRQCALRAIFYRPGHFAHSMRPLACYDCIQVGPKG